MPTIQFRLPDSLENKPLILEELLPLEESANPQDSSFLAICSERQELMSKAHLLFFKPHNPTTLSTLPLPYEFFWQEPKVALIPLSKRRFLILAPELLLDPSTSNPLCHILKISDTYSMSLSSLPIKMESKLEGDLLHLTTLGISFNRFKLLYCQPPSSAHCANRSIYSIEGRLSHSHCFLKKADGPFDLNKQTSRLYSYPLMDIKPYIPPPPTPQPQVIENQFTISNLIGLTTNAYVGYNVNQGPRSIEVAIGKEASNGLQKAKVAMGSNVMFEFDAENDSATLFGHKINIQEIRPPTSTSRDTNKIYGIYDTAKDRYVEVQEQQSLFSSELSSLVRTFSRDVKAIPSLRLCNSPWHHTIIKEPYNPKSFHLVSHDRRHKERAFTLKCDFTNADSPQICFFRHHMTTTSQFQHLVSLPIHYSPDLYEAPLFNPLDPCAILLPYAQDERISEEVTNYLLNQRSALKEILSPCQIGLTKSYGTHLFTASLLGNIVKITFQDLKPTLCLPSPTSLSDPSTATRLCISRTDSKGIQTAIFISKNHFTKDIDLFLESKKEFSTLASQEFKNNTIELEASEEALLTIERFYNHNEKILPLEELEEIVSISTDFYLREIQEAASQQLLTVGIQNFLSQAIEDPSEAIKELHDLLDLTLFHSDHPHRHHYIEKLSLSLSEILSQIDWAPLLRGGLLERITQKSTREKRDLLFTLLGF
jgi:hypothetical protein